ncbi:hypothetical protein [Fusibacter bizertensis]
MSKDNDTKKTNDETKIEIGSFSKKVPPANFEPPQDKSKSKDN